MKLFDVEPDEKWLGRFQIHASHKWSLPGVKCSSCGWIGGTPGLAYPSLSLPPELESHPYLDPSPVSPDRLRELLGPLRPLLRKELPVRAGMAFGPLVGDAKGRFPDVVFVGLTMLISTGVIHEMQRQGVKGLLTVNPILCVRSETQFDHLEIQIEPHLQLDEKCIAQDNRCPQCATRRVDLVDEDWGGMPAVVEGSLPRDCDLARIDGLEGYIVATETFVQAATSLEVSGIIFEEISVTNESSA